MRHHGGVASDIETPPGDRAATGAPRPNGPHGAPPARPRTLKTVRDMVLSMAVVCVGVFAVWLLLPHDASRDAAPVRVEYEVAAASAARDAPYQVLIPRGLGDRWRATSVDYQPQAEHGTTWRLGFVNPDDEYAALAQADGAAEPFVSQITHGAEATGATERIAGQEWTRYEGPKYDALVLTGPEVTTVVYGTAPFDSLGRLAAALDPA